VTRTAPSTRLSRDSGPSASPCPVDTVTDHFTPTVCGEQLARSTPGRPAATSSARGSAIRPAAVAPAGDFRPSGSADRQDLHDRERHLRPDSGPSPSPVSVFNHAREDHVLQPGDDVTVIVRLHRRDAAQNAPSRRERSPAPTWPVRGGKPPCPSSLTDPDATIAFSSRFHSTALLIGRIRTRRQVS
jgi:hypothetical protein